MAAPSIAAPARAAGPSPGFTLTLIALGLAVLGLALAYAIDAAGRAAAASTAGSYTRTLGAAKLEIPAAWLREDARHNEGFSRQVELGVTLPLGPAATPRRIDITLLPRSRARPSALLLDGVYLHQFLPEQLAGPPGLIGKPLAPQGGFAGETVWYDALSPAPFVAKCSAPVLAETGGRCLRTVHLGPGIAAIYDFDEDVLLNWKRFDAELHPLLQRIGAL
jgi:hypothetical protein